MRTQDKHEMTKWTYRANARRKSEFGVHEQSKYDVRGASTIRHYVVNNPAAAKSMILDNIACLRVMRGERFKSHLEAMRAVAVAYYKVIQ